MLGAWYGLVTLILASMAGNSVLQVIVLLTESIKRDLSLSDTQIGALRGIGTTLVLAIASYPVSWLADRIDRRLIFAVCIFIWSVATALSGLSTTYAMLFACAMGIAVGETVLGPVVFSLIPDLFPPEKRMIANSIFFIAQLLGYSIGLAAGGLLINAIDAAQGNLPTLLQGMATWRITLIATALPGIVLIPMVLTIPVKRRPKVVAAADGARPTGGVLPYFRAHARTLFALFIGFGAVGAANFTVFGWMAVAIVRIFGKSPAEVGIMLSQVFAVGSILGVVGANLLAKLLARYDADLAPLRVAQIGAVTALLLSLLYLVAQTPTHFYVIAVFQIAASFGGLALSPTVTQSVSPARIRARLIALGGLFYVGFGALSPLTVGLISDALGKDPYNLLVAMMLVAVPAFAGGALLLRMGERTLRATMDAVRIDDAALEAEQQAA